MLSDPTRMSTIAAASPRCDNRRLGFESEKARLAGLAFTPHEAFRSVGDSPKSPADLNPVPYCRPQERDRHHESKPA